MGKKTKISGQAGAVGDNAHVHHNAFNQTENTEVKTQIDGERNIAIAKVNKSKITIRNKNIVNQTAYTALHQLPRPSADFVGRDKEMTELLHVVENGGVTISGLQGMGGIGKTALALELAAQLKPKYPDAQFYLDLKGASKEPLSASDAMAHVIRSFHPEAKLPEDENSLRGIYNSLLEGKKALLLMDNAASATQVKLLIPPTGSIMLVTSRNHFTLSGFFVKNLDMLEPNDAKALLLKIAPRIDKSAEKIAELCGYLPLALEVAASAVHKAINLTPDEYMKRLSKATKRLELVDASLSLSYEILSEELQKLWRMLSVFPNTFDDDAVAALWELSVEDAQDRLAELISYSLIEWNETTKRYRLHDLVRVFADSRLNEQERLDVKKAHATYYKNLLSVAGDLYLQGGDSIISGLALYDLERENVEAGQAWAAALLGQDNTATELSEDYYFAGVEVYSLRLHPQEQIRHLEVTLKAAQILKAKGSEGNALGNLGLAYADLGEVRKAIEFQEQRIAIAREIGDRRGEGNALGNLGNAYLSLGEVRKAIEFYEQALLIDREFGDRRGEGTALGNLGLAYWNLGEVRKAIEFYEQRIAIACGIGDRRGEGITLGNLGNAYAELGEMRKAIEFYEQYLAIAREIGDRRGEGNALGNLGNGYADLGEVRKAIEFYEQYLAIACGIGDRRGEGTALGNLGLAYWNLGEVRKAIEFYEQYLAIACGIGDRRGEGNALGNLGAAYWSLGEVRKAIEFYEQALLIYREIGDRRGEGIDLWNTALAYDKLGNRTQAINFAEMALAIFEQIEHPRTSKVRSTLAGWKSEAS
jgi:tetratricopeptide (TPR) repeat protein